MQKVFEAAQSYVMLSRVENLNQLIIINDVCSKKIYSSAFVQEDSIRYGRRIWHLEFQLVSSLTSQLDDLMRLANIH